MFTGLIEAVGTLARLERVGAAARITVEAPLPGGETCLGDSVAINGACLTVVSIGPGTLAFDVSPETLAQTTFQRLPAGSRVNLERALRLGDRFGGHIVTGHVDCLATLAGRQELSGNLLLRFRLPAAQARYVISKGSVAIEGVSLTVNEVGPDAFSVNVIPHTAQCTTLGGLRPGDEVNLETDLLGKYVERLLGTRAKGEVSLDLLKQAGFL